MARTRHHSGSKRLTREQRRIHAQQKHLREHLAHHRKNVLEVSEHLFGQRLTVEDLSGAQRYSVEAYLLDCQRQIDLGSLERMTALPDDVQRQVLEDLLR
ncbi:hypothetical protein [Deinococcus ficus]|uniref:Uncharacterized protein n=1 Tax=Deinococcus ficus TaxID=317577 RepID=A0A221T2P4_9DEIO|nr:hypothetical protein [Deinococcus ficus]ASN83174.1 hypothetical protein DFI_18410 [Deinococcus ficus]